ncbi:hypothetical protein [Winogradskyella sp.]|uniref:hypothetical protein n=1 Tax=Winogradskyella sp. TaxID=1883156 RepID=UPI0025DF623A|nr:hypothetical protein [Winogradskyella sp.]
MSSKFIYILSLLFLISCADDKPRQKVEDENSNEQKTEAITTKAIENFKFNDYILSDDAKNEVTNWSKFQELSTQISYLRTADVTFFTDAKDTLKVFLDSLRVSIPDNINTNSINSRISVLETKLLKLNNDLKLDNYAVDNKLKSIKELLIANSNLIYMINKEIEIKKRDVGRPEGE